MNSFIRKHISTVLCVIATAGIAATAVLTAKATPKAMKLIEEAKKEKEELSKAETVIAAAPAYIPAIVSGVMTAACIFGANALSIKQQASLMSAYGILHANYGKYTGKVKELFGIKTHHDILDAIAVEKADENVYNYAPDAFGCGSTSLGTDCIEEEKRLFYDAYSDRYFEATMGRVLEAEYHLNRNYALGADVTINDFYLFLGIDKIDGGDDVGWSGYSGEIGWIDFDNYLSKLKDGKECMVISLVFEPMIFEEYA